jgi:hypothetical protein
VEAGCGKAACPVLCGGCIAICVPTAIRISRHRISPELALWEALTLPRRVGALLGEGHERASIAKAMMAGIVEVADSHRD